MASSNQSLVQHVLENLEYSCDCKDGRKHVCYDLLGRYLDDTEDGIQLLVLTYINTVMAVSPSDQDNEVQASGGASRSTKRVTFSDKVDLSLLRDANEAAEIPQLSRVDTKQPFPSVWTPSVIEKIIVCDCTRHKHCATCQFTDPRWKSGMDRPSSLGPGANKATNWVSTAYALDRAFKVWIGEFAAECGGWHRRQENPGHERACFVEVVKLSFRIHNLNSRYTKHVARTLRKLKKPLLLCQEYARKDEQEAGDKESHKAFARNKKLVYEAVYSLFEVLSGIISVVRSLIDNAESVQESSGEYETLFFWPVQTQRKAEFIKRVLINVELGASVMFMENFEMMGIWEVDLKESNTPGEWTTKIVHSAKLFEHWLARINDGVRLVADSDLTRAEKCRCGSQRNCGSCIPS